MSSVHPNTSIEMVGVSCLQIFRHWRLINASDRTDYDNWNQKCLPNQTQTDDSACERINFHFTNERAANGER